MFELRLINTMDITYIGGKDMKKYWKYTQVYIGCSDIATLIAVGPNDTQSLARELRFLEDNDYYAYVVDSEAEIPKTFELVLTFRNWLKIYDDGGLVYKSPWFGTGEIKIYRDAESRDCIIQMPSLEEAY